MRFNQISSVVAVLLLASTVYSAQIPVFFAGGQSNAGPDWAAGLEQAIAESNQFANYEFVHVNHGGNEITRWFDNRYPTTQPWRNYWSDFFNDSPDEPDGVLQSRLNEILANGDQPILAGFFWFQGESDTVLPHLTTEYKNNFHGLMAVLENDLGTQDFPLAIANIAYAEDNPYDEARNERIAAMRQNLIDLGQESPNAMTFETIQYPRGWYIPSQDRIDVVHIPPSLRHQAGYEMASAFLDQFYNGDMNKDGVVNGFDVDPFVESLLSGQYNPIADINRDGLVNGFDVDPFVELILSSGAEVAVEIPEPATLFVMGLGGAILLRVKRQHQSTHTDSPINK